MIAVHDRILVNLAKGFSTPHGVWLVKNLNELLLTVSGNLLKFLSQPAGERFSCKGFAIVRIRRSVLMSTIGQRIREIRKSRNLTQRELADRVGINFTYLSRVENDRLDDEQTPREETLQRIAKALRTDPDELLLLARRIPDAYRDRILSRPGVFRKLLNLSDTALEEMIQQMEQQSDRASSPR